VKISVEVDTKGDIFEHSSRCSVDEMEQFHFRELGKLSSGKVKSNPERKQRHICLYVFLEVREEASGGGGDD